MASVQQRKLTREQAALVHEAIRRRDALRARRGELFYETEMINAELRTLRYGKIGERFGVSARTIEAIAQGINYREVKP